MSDIGLLGFGRALPARVRTNDDPVFAELEGDRSAEAAFFAGTDERRVLAPDEAIEDFMIEAGRAALDDAGVRPEQIDRVYGYAFVSEYSSPNGLYLVHHGLGLDPRAMVVPINAEFSNFITSVTLAWEAIAAGRARHVLVVCGSSMSRHVAYSSGHSVSVGDGAGAVVVGPSPRFRVLDHESRTLSDAFDVMNMKPRPFGRPGARRVAVDGEGMALPTYEMRESAMQVVMKQGAEVPPEMVAALLARNGVEPAQVALVTHQPARALMDHWQRAIGPAEYFDTYDRYGNVALASVPITLAETHGRMTAPYLVLASPGTGTHFAALLLRR